MLNIRHTGIYVEDIAKQAEFYKKCFFMTIICLSLIHISCSESYIDGIRVIFKKGIMHEAMEYCRAIKKLGYKVYSYSINITF